ncbi:hypothetical protein L6452_39542 [Arctium lappa]|uniref:Uncharacterized protein n=1 Tax=Arctium lappa TaxID=4217 RepID=A0ACB8XSL1_ARCLA|nr:hypothetical protein L6452_39542 [Arctium lappa]
MEIDCLMEKLRQRPPVSRISSHQRPPSSAATRWRSSANATEQKSNALSLSPSNNSSLLGSISKQWKKDPTQNNDGLRRHVDFLKVTPYNSHSLSLLLKACPPSLSSPISL